MSNLIPFSDSADFLSLQERIKNDPKFVSDYIRVSLEFLPDKSKNHLFLETVLEVAKVYGIAEIAKKTGIKRESIYRSLSPKGNPRLSTISAIMNVLGLSLTVEPIEPTEKVRL